MNRIILAFLALLSCAALSAQSTCEISSAFLAGCDDPTACNYNYLTTNNNGSCIYVDGICETCSGEIDGTGTVVDNDWDDDGVCRSCNMVLNLAYHNSSCENNGDYVLDEDPETGGLVEDNLGPGDYFYIGGCAQSTPGWSLQRAKNECLNSDWCVGFQRNTNHYVTCSYGSSTLHQYMFCATANNVWYTNNVSSGWWEKVCTD